MKALSYGAVTALAAIALGAAACSGNKEEVRSSPQLGSEQNTSGESTIVTQKEESRTISSESNIPTVSSTTTRADINRMDEQQLMTVGFPKSVAENVVLYRDAHGPFQSVNDLRRVNGVSDNLLAQVKDKVGTSVSH